jgi:hypothetical protein
MRGNRKSVASDMCDGNLYACTYGDSNGWNSQLHCKADMREHMFVAFNVCVQNYEISVMSKHAILFQSWQNRGVL